MQTIFIPERDCDFLPKDWVAASRGPWTWVEVHNLTLGTRRTVFLAEPHRQAVFNGLATFATITETIDRAIDDEPFSLRIAHRVQPIRLDLHASLDRELQFLDELCRVNMETKWVSDGPTWRAEL